MYLGKPKKKFTRKLSNGVTRIVRDSYHTVKQSWYTTIDTIKERDQRCTACGNPNGPFHTHHIRPLSRGGTTSKRNLMLLCERCHKLRHSHM